MSNSVEKMSFEHLLVSCVNESLRYLNRCKLQLPVDYRQICFSSSSQLYTAFPLFTESTSCFPLPLSSYGKQNSTSPFWERDRRNTFVHSWNTSMINGSVKQQWIAGAYIVVQIMSAGHLYYFRS